jgi:hypothetical protein
MPSSKLMGIAWPAFLAACAMELLVFALVDPHELHWSGQPLGWSRQAVYSAAFFLFWAIAAGSGALTALLGMPATQVNGPLLPSGEAPGVATPP